MDWFDNVILLYMTLKKKVVCMCMNDCCNINEKTN